eukprot:TRINITY_DN1584_c0_g1_i1.p1 TRINITY_DN1584_c0_g1~~TRINITY_DN1584_c0_g1_i1.p1  ORF type:complete len:463 (-),score=64.75 TRINITY_DN1584_c0_g1_i1:129-1517(-)
MVWLALLFFLSLCALLFISAIQRLVANKEFLVNKKEIPGEIMEDDCVPGDEYFAAMNKKHGDVFNVTFLGETYTVLTGKKGIDFFKQNERKYFQVKGSSPESWDELYGTSNPILTVPETVHKLFRRACTNAMMSMKAIESFYPVVNKILEDFVLSWEGQEKIHSHQIAKIAFAISWVWVFGDRGEKSSDMFDLFRVFVQALSAPVNTELGTPYGDGLDARRKIVDHFKEIYEHPPTDKIPHLYKTFHEYIEQEDKRGTPKYEKRMSDLLVGVLFAAYHAISMSLNGALWELGTNEALQKNLREEFCTQLEKYKTGTETPEKCTSHLTLHDLSKLPLCNNFVMEVLRLYNAGFGIYRLTIADFEIDGYTVPKGSKAFIFCGYDHYNVMHPWNFDENRDHESYQWEPFGVGSRSCMGQKFSLMEIKSFIFIIVTRFHFKISDVIPRAFPEFEIDGDIQISPVRT